VWCWSSELLNATGQNRSTRGYCKAGIHPFEKYGGLQIMNRQEQQANGTHVAEISWVVVPRDENDKEEISDADKVVLLSGEWPRFLTDISPIFAALLPPPRRASSLFASSKPRQDAISAAVVGSPPCSLEDLQVRRSRRHLPRAKRNVCANSRWLPSGRDATRPTTPARVCCCQAGA
jgi:hypothetical protein